VGRRSDTGADDRTLETAFDACICVGLLLFRGGELGVSPDECWPTFMMMTDERMTEMTRAYVGVDTDLPPDICRIT
jgi:hypothetical protein